MILWFDRLYMEEALKKHKKRCIKRIESEKIWEKNYTLITLAANEVDLFELIDSREFFFRYYKQRKIYVAGIARNRDAALALLQQMLLDSYQDGNFSPRRTFSKEHFGCL